MKTLAAAVLLAGIALAQKLPQEMTFPSGRRLVIVNKVHLHVKLETGFFSDSLAMEYQTRVNPADAAALQKEIDDLWPWLRKDAAHRKMQFAAIHAVRESTPGGDHLASFFFEKQPDGEWKATPARRTTFTNR